MRAIEHEFQINLQSIEFLLCMRQNNSSKKHTATAHGESRREKQNKTKRIIYASETREKKTAVLWILPFPFQIHSHTTNSSEMEQILHRNVILYTTTYFFICQSFVSIALDRFGSLRSLCVCVFFSHRANVVYINRNLCVPLRFIVFFAAALFWGIKWALFRYFFFFFKSFSLVAVQPQPQNVETTSNYIDERWITNLYIK